MLKRCTTTTSNLGLFKYNTTGNANISFSIDTALNGNWDILDNSVQNKSNIDLDKLDK